MADKQPTFADRRARMAEIASALVQIGQELQLDAEFLNDEAKRMAAAEKRFSERRADRRKADK